MYAEIGLFVFMYHTCSQCNRCTYVTRQGHECQLYEDDTSVETCRSVVIYKFIVIVPLLVNLQNKKIEIQVV